MKQTIENVIAWAKARNLLPEEQGNPCGTESWQQIGKLIEEVNELDDAVKAEAAYNRVGEPVPTDDIRDGVGDCMVVLIIIATLHGLTLDECLAAAYEEIKDRKGRMIDGVFVKDV